MRIPTKLSSSTIMLAALCLGACASVRKPQEIVEVQEPMPWPEHPVLPCRARVAYAQEFFSYSQQGLPEQRIVIADDWEPAEERAEILEIRRRAYHDREGLREVMACAGGKDT